MHAVDGQQTPARPRRLRALALASLPLLLAACGGTSSDTVTPQAPASSTSAAPSTDLTIVVVDNGKTDTWTLTCDPAGGTHPHPGAACAALTAKGRTALPPVAKDVMCTQIYGGSQTAKITGTWRGEPVNASFSRQNGCQVARWKALEGLLPVTAGAGT
jgi:Subtilisin inhibitor-like